MRTPPEIVKCEALNLEVPANAEIALEDTLLPNIRLSPDPMLLPGILREARIYENVKSPVPTVKLVPYPLSGPVNSTVIFQ